MSNTSLLNFSKDSDEDLGLWRVSLTVQARALNACEEILGPALGAPGHEADDWITGIEAYSTVPLDPNAEEKPDRLWRIEALCADEPTVPALQDVLTPVAKAFDFDLPEITIEPVESIDWVQAALISHPPVRAGRFHVHGQHEPVVPRHQAIDILIDAGRAFGTGNHQSTQGCLMALDDLARRHHFNNIADLGAGSGILSFAAAKRWRVPVVGIDIDPVAADFANDYAKLNRVADLTKFVAGDGFNHPLLRGNAPYDLILANILARPLKRLAPDIRKYLAPGGRVVLAGLLDRQERYVLAAYAAQGIHLEKRICLKEWTILVLAG
jgi:ribosomal protein L11 methyltransferase